MSRQYSVNEEQKKQFASAYLLEKMINKPLKIPIFLDGNNQDLEPVLEYCMIKEYIKIENNKDYIPTDKGRDVLLRFMKRYHDFLKHYDIYCAVDLGKGEFAFEQYFEYNHELSNYESNYKSNYENEWIRYLNEDRWEDLRVTVSEFKKINPVEIVFMSFLNECRFGETEEGWQFDLLLGSVWDDILNICNSALITSELEYKNSDGEIISGETVIKDIITQGAELQMELRKKEEKLYGVNKYNNNDNDVNATDHAQAVSKVKIEDDDYIVYESYYDPFYVHPCWGTTIFL